MLGVDAHGGNLPEELLVLSALLDRFGERGLCFFEVEEPAASDALLTQFGLLGVFEDVELELPSPPFPGLVVAQ